MGSEDAIVRFATLLNETAKKLRAEKMRVGYHSHPFDFAKIGGRFAWEVLFSHVDPEVIMQLDVGNCLAGKRRSSGHVAGIPRPHALDPYQGARR